MFPFFSFGSLHFPLRLLRCIIYLFIYLHILLVSFLPLLIFIIFVLSIASFLFSPIITHLHEILMYLVALPNHFFSASQHSPFLFLFYITQKLPHQGSYGAIKNKHPSSSSSMV